jgi:hypothetical protein
LTFSNTCGGLKLLGSICFEETGLEEFAAATREPAMASDELSSDVSFIVRVVCAP